MDTQKKENLFQASMWFGLIVLITLGIILSCKSCQAQDKLDTNNLQELNPYENNWEVLDYDGAILMVPSNVLDFIYHTQDNEYIIEYNDPDAFDLDDMLYHNDGDYYYIEIHCDSALFFEYLNHYNSLGGHKNPKFSEASEIYFIEEDFLKNDESYYKLVKYGTDTENNQ